MPNASRKKVLNPTGSSIIAQNWDKKETLSQNYSRFGLVAKLGHTAGGVEKSSRTTHAPVPRNPLDHKPKDLGLLQMSEVKVERDADGRIVRVLRDTNPLKDPLNEIEDASDDESMDDGEEWGGIDLVNDRHRPSVVRELEKEANCPTEKTVRHQSDRELEWLRDLVAKYGDDAQAMTRDRKLNPMQQTAADLRKRLKKAGLLS
ncbi:hypothetical protein OQA88_6513 [Cercophora sp. LCS_1]